MKKDNKDNKFYTVRGYALLRQEDNFLTPSMEDYLEMAYRLSRERGYSRIGDLASSLNVQPPSASKMVNKLAELGYLSYEKYGIVELTGQGRELGEYLLRRHETIERFLKIIGVMEGILEETEKIEHHLREETIERVKILVEFMQNNQQWMDAFNVHQKRLK